MARPVLPLPQECVGRIAWRGPEDAAGRDLEGRGRQNIVDAEIARSGRIAPIRGVESWVSAMGGIVAALLRCCHEGACAAGGWVL